MRSTIVAVLLLLAARAPAQVPGTDIYLIQVRDGLIAPSSDPINATARAGYDNQPAFLDDSSGLRFTSIDSTGQADIWLHDLASGARRNLTGNGTSEYSATSIPGQERFSVVRVEADSTQRLWSFADDGSDARLVIESPSGVGYHAWGAESELILFILGSPHELHRARAGSNGSQFVASDVGRCLQPIPGADAWSFPLADEEHGWVIRRLDRGTGELTTIAPVPAPQVQDYCWTPDGALWSSDGSTILEWRDDGWHPLRDLGPEGITGISRMAVSPDGNWLAFVADDPAGNR